MAAKKAIKKGKTLHGGKALRKQKTLTTFPVTKTADSASPNLF